MLIKRNGLKVCTALPNEYGEWYLDNFMVDDRIYDFCREYPEGEGSRRQDLEPCYIRNGAIYAMTRDCIVEEFSRHGKVCLPYVMKESESVNIDTMLDFKLAEMLFKTFR